MIKIEAKEFSKNINNKIKGISTKYNDLERYRMILYIHIIRPHILNKTKKIEYFYV